MGHEGAEPGAEGLHLISPVFLDGFPVCFGGIRVVIHCVRSSTADREMDAAECINLI